MNKIKTLILALLLAGCQSMGFRHGYNKAREFYDGASGNMHVPAYSYGFMRGWESYKMERARRIRLNELAP